MMEAVRTSPVVMPRKLGVQAGSFLCGGMQSAASRLSLLVTGHLLGARVIAAMELGPGHGFYVDQWGW
jgi:hypothetical protein